MSTEGVCIRVVSIIVKKRAMVTRENISSNLGKQEFTLFTGKGLKIVIVFFRKRKSTRTNSRTCRMRIINCITPLLNIPRTRVDTAQTFFPPP